MKNRLRLFYFEFLFSWKWKTKNKNPGKNNVLNPNFLTGFADGEGCFAVILKKQPAYKIGWKVEPRFSIGLHKKDLAPERVDEQARCPLWPPSGG